MPFNLNPCCCFPSLRHCTPASFTAEARFAVATSDEEDDINSRRGAAQRQSHHDALLAKDPSAPWWQSEPPWVGLTGYFHFLIYKTRSVNTSFLEFLKHHTPIIITRTEKCSNIIRGRP